MVNNPFILVGDIPAPYFCDRQQEIARLIKGIHGGENICLVSARRMGKSRLVKHCSSQQEIADNYYFFYVDLLHTSSLRDFAFAFGRCVFDTLQNRGEKFVRQFLSVVQSLTVTMSVDPLSSLPQFGLSLNPDAQPEYTFESIFRYLENADKPCIVCFDEFQQINRYPEKNVEALLRSHIQHMSNAHFIFSGSERHMLEEMFNSSAHPFYNSASYMGLEAIPKDKYIEFACYWFEQYKKHIDADLVHLIYSLAEGNTYTMQRISHELFDILAPEETVNRQMLTQAVNNIIEAETPRYARLLSHVPERQQSLLFAIAKEGRVQKIMSGAFLRKYHLSSSSTVQNAIKHLLEMDLVTQDDKKQFVVEDIFLRMYLNRISEK
ncbi:MAG: ATP-binding protein [Paludibacteraceae bacterium]|nr:ATP-binding protein [Paludibacteraceae bacterium]